MRTYLLQLSLLLTPIILLGQGISMSPTRMFFTGNPGETVTQTVRLANSSESDFTLSVNYKDWERDLTGHKIYREAGSMKQSNAEWLSTDQTVITIPAHGYREVQVTMQIPDDIPNKKVTNSMLFFTQVPSQEDQASASTGIGIITLFEFGLHVYHTPTGNQISSLGIANMEEVIDADNQSRKVVVTIENDGNTIADGSVEFELTNTDTGAEIKLDPISISMFPGAEQIVTFAIPDDLSGNYLGVAIVRIAGSNDLRVGEKSFTF